MRPLTLCLALLAGCGPSTEVSMSFDRAGGFYAAPFPSDDLRRPDGTIDLTRFPNAEHVAFVDQVLEVLADARGFAVSGGAFFHATAPLDAKQLPTVATSVLPDSPIFLVGIDPASPDYRRRYPLEVSFQTDGGPFGADNLLSLLPLQGVPLRPSTAYAAVVTRRLLDSQGHPLAPSHTMAEIAAGTRPSSLPDSAWTTYQRAITSLSDMGVDPRDIAGLAAFTTGDPTLDLGVVRAEALAHALPAPKPFPTTPAEIFPDYCVYATTIAMPVYQSGTPPFTKTGGKWAFDPSGKPLLQRSEVASFFVTIPRAKAPAAGFPIAVFIRTGGGGDRPLVDRGVHAIEHGPAIEPGTGPALQFARAGFAGVSVDGPLGGLRNTTMGDEQFLVFNFFNPQALRDNVRQSALEIALLPAIFDTLTVDVTECPGALAGDGSTTARFDVGHLALMGHSMGATIAPLTLAAEPRYRATILSGAGASWIENILYKKKPVEIRPLAEILLTYSTEGRDLTSADPVLTLVQWAGEPADPQAYARRVVADPPPSERARHVLMLQGIVDNYILPRIANSLSLAFGLDLAGDELDAKAPDPILQTPLAQVIGLVGRQRIALPASANFGGQAGPATTVVVQHPGDAIEDGHEVIFQTDAPKHQYRCFLEAFAKGVPTVLQNGAADAPCN